MSPRLFACVIGLVALPMADAAAEKPRPPKPKNIEVEVMRGGSVQIPLRGFERNLNRIEYRTIGSPRYGRLSGLTQYEGPDRQGPGQVTYTHSNDDVSTTDTFAFEVISKPSNLRGRGRITIRILDAPAKLNITPSTLDFGAVAVGDPAAQRMVELANEGGGTIQGFLEVPEPFSLADDGMFVLRRGEKTRIPVLFVPEKPGAFLFRVQPVPGDPTILTLKGDALSPFSIEADDPSFILQPDASRIARARVRNASQQSQTISVHFPQDSPVEPVEALDLAPGETSEITFRIPPEHKTAVRPFDVRFESNGSAQVQEFAAPAVPASLVVVATPDFGEVRAGTASEAVLVLRNEGGATLEARLLDHESIMPVNGVTAISIAPGAELAIPLKLKLKKNQTLPTGISISFQANEVPVAIKAAPAPSPSPTATPTPTATPPPAAVWALNDDITFVPAPEGPAIAWREKPGYSNFVLQHSAGGNGPWQRYELPAPHEGLIEWFWNLVRRIEKKIEKFLTTEIKRPDVDAMATPEQPLAKTPIDEASVDTDLWRLTAAQNGSPAQSVSATFRIEQGKLVAVKDQPEPQPEAAPMPSPSPLPLTQPKPVVRLGPETSMASAGIKADRDTALLQVAFATDLGVQSFRLERGAMVSEIDPKNEIPGAPKFEPMNPPEAEIELLGVGKGEAEGRKFTVCLARISQLQPGTRTYWRLVPSGPAGELPPTSVLLVDTEPLPPWPWNTILLGALFALLAGVLYLRWRVNRVPR